MPVDMARYPKDWKAVSLARKEAAYWKCEWCLAPHGQTVARVPHGFWSVVECDVDPDDAWTDTEDDAWNDTEDDAWNDTEDVVWHDARGQRVTVRDVADALGVGLDYGPEGQLLPECRLWTSKVVLTCAHLGPTKHDKMDVSNLAALCQSCHLREDLADHIAHGRETRMRRKAAGSLFDMEAA